MYSSHINIYCSGAFSIYIYIYIYIYIDIYIYLFILVANLPSFFVLNHITVCWVALEKHLFLMLG